MALTIESMSRRLDLISENQRIVIEKLNRLRLAVNALRKEKAGRAPAAGDTGNDA